MTIDVPAYMRTPKDLALHFAPGLLFAAAAADPVVWGRISAALDAAMADPECHTIAPRCVFNGAA